MRFFQATALLCGLLASASYALQNETAPSTRYALPNDFIPPPTFKNVNLLRNINLEKTYIRETINVVIKNTDKKPQNEYYIPFAADIIDKVGGLEVRDKNAENKGKFEVVPTDLLSSR